MKRHVLLSSLLLLTSMHVHAGSFIDGVKHQIDKTITRMHNNAVYENPECTRLHTEMEKYLERYQMYEDMDVERGMARLGSKILALNKAIKARNCEYRKRPSPPAKKPSVAQNRQKR